MNLITVNFVLDLQPSPNYAVPEPRDGHDGLLGQIECTVGKFDSRYHTEVHLRLFNVQEIFQITLDSLVNTLKRVALVLIYILHLNSKYTFV